MAKRARVELQSESMRTDTERLNALEELVERGACPGIINDDNGHWAVAGDGVQNVPWGDGPVDISTSFFVEAGRWKNTIREAIDDFLDDDQF